MRHRTSGPPACWRGTLIELYPSRQNGATHVSSSVDFFRSLLLVATGIASPNPTVCRLDTEGGTPQPIGDAHADSAKMSEAEDLDKTIEQALKSDRWDEAIARAEELVALRSSAGADPF